MSAGMRGFTLVELMVTVALVALLMAIGVPTFRDVSLGSRLTAAANNVLASVQLARSEAIKRNLSVTLCASADGATCAGGGGWEQGWIVLDSGGDLLQRQEAMPDGYVMSQTGGVIPLVFDPIGIGSTAATITVCRQDPLGSQERIVNVNAAGSVHVETATTGVCP
jgi:type IV fimbrial biogenesis protein FimT